MAEQMHVLSAVKPSQTNPRITQCGELTVTKTEPALDGWSGSLPLPSGTAFALGVLNVSRNVRRYVDASVVKEALDRYANKDWGAGDTSQYLRNEHALATGKRVFAHYEFGPLRILILTEGDRSLTRVLFPDEL